MLGASIQLDEGFSEKLSEAKSFGFESLDYDLTRFWRDAEREKELYKGLEKGLECIKKSGLFLNGVHLSFGTEWDFSDLNEDKRRDAVSRSIEI
ncbi:MAG: hypothetical protein J5903_04095, partial [Clostridia bacterium]|nr:hypothetical protein [Clostridia bacterium]